MPRLGFRSALLSPSPRRAGRSCTAAGRLRQLPTPVLREAASSTADASSYQTVGQYLPTARTLQLLIVLAAQGTTAETPMGITGCNLGWSLVTGSERFLGASGALRKLSWWLAAGSAPTLDRLTIAFAGVMTTVLWQWIEVPGADLSSSIIQTAVNGSAAATTINSTLANNFEHPNNINISAVGLATQADVVPDPDFAELGDDNEATPGGTLEVQWARNQRLCDPTFASAVCGISSLEVRAA